ncbi:hypothetical protein D3C71_1892850 [compost metagenome]
MPALLKVVWVLPVASTFSILLMGRFLKIDGVCDCIAYDMFGVENGLSVGCCSDPVVAVMTMDSASGGNEQGVGACGVHG